MGRPPKDDGQKINKHPLVLEWIDVVDEPFDGPLLEDLRPQWEWTHSTQQWWEAIRRMPHCALWRDPEWQFALLTAEMVQIYRSEKTASLLAQITRRELIMGVTADARRQQRIRYITALAENPQAPAPKPAGSAKSDPRRRLKAV